MPSSHVSILTLVPSSDVGKSTLGVHWFLEKIVGQHPNLPKVIVLVLVLPSAILGSRTGNRRPTHQKTHRCGSLWWFYDLINSLLWGKGCWSGPSLKILDHVFEGFWMMVFDDLGYLGVVFDVFWHVWRGGAFSSWPRLAGYLSFVEGTACAGERDNCKRECFEPLGSVYVTRIIFQDWTGSVLELEQVHCPITGDTPRFRSRNAKHRFLLTVQLLFDIQSSGKWWRFLDVCMLQIPPNTWTGFGLPHQALMFDGITCLKGLAVNTWVGHVNLYYNLYFIFQNNYFKQILHICTKTLRTFQTTS